MFKSSQGILSSTGPVIKSLAGAHPVALGVVVGIGAYYAFNKYWLNTDNSESPDAEEENEIAA